MHLKAKKKKYTKIPILLFFKYYSYLNCIIVYTAAINIPHSHV